MTSGGDIIEPGGAEYESASRSVLASGPVEIHVVFDGDDPDLAAQAIDPIRRLGTVTGDDIALTPYADTLTSERRTGRGSERTLVPVFRQSPHVGMDVRSS